MEDDDEPQEPEDYDDGEMPGDDDGEDDESEVQFDEGSGEAEGGEDDEDDDDEDDDDENEGGDGGIPMATHDLFLPHNGNFYRVGKYNPDGPGPVTMGWVRQYAATLEVPTAKVLTALSKNQASAWSDIAGSMGFEHAVVLMVNVSADDPTPYPVWYTLPCVEHGDSDDCYILRQMPPPQYKALFKRIKEAKWMANSSLLGLLKAHNDNNVSVNPKINNFVLANGKKQGKDGPSYPRPRTLVVSAPKKTAAPKTSETEPGEPTEPTEPEEPADLEEPGEPKEAEPEPNPPKKKKKKAAPAGDDASVATAPASAAGRGAERRQLERRRWYEQVLQGAGQERRGRQRGGGGTAAAPRHDADAAAAAAAPAAVPVGGGAKDPASKKSPAPGRRGAPPAGGQWHGSSGADGGAGGGGGGGGGGAAPAAAPAAAAANGAPKAARPLKRRLCGSFVGQVFEFALNEGATEVTIPLPKNFKAPAPPALTRVEVKWNDAEEA